MWCWFGAAGCDRIIGNLASRGPWDHDHKLNTPTLTTRGNNAKSATSWVSDILPSAPQHMPVSVTRDYNYPWTNSWNNDECEPTPNGHPCHVNDSRRRSPFRVTKMQTVRFLATERN